MTRLGDCLDEVTQGVGPSWGTYRVLGATRDGLAPAKEPVGKVPERYKPVHPGTIFYNPMRILLGSIALLDEGQESGITSPDYVVFRPRPGVVHARWFYYWLRSDAGASFIRTLARGAVRERMLFRRLAAAAINLPPFEQQERFAECAQDVERARVAAEAQREAASRLASIQMEAIFQKSGGRDCPYRGIGEIAQVVGGIQKGPSRAPAKLHRPYLTVRNVQRGWLDLTTVERFEVTRQEIERLRLVTDDLLIVEGNGSLDHIGRNAIFAGDGQEWVHQNHVIRVRLVPELALAKFISAYLNSASGMRQMVEKARTTSGLYTLSTGKVCSLKVPVPSTETQTRVIAQVSALREAADGLQRKLELASQEIDALPAALLRRAFSGEL